MDYRNLGVVAVINDSGVGGNENFFEKVLDKVFDVVYFCAV
jgi:hypothetical protein